MADSGRKRKRQGDGTPKPSKKVAIQAPSPVESVHVSLVEGTDAWAPIVVSTPGLAVPSSIAFKPYTTGRKNVSISTHDDPSSAIAKQELLLHSSSHPTIDYLGREEAGSADSLLKHYLGVYDPTTGMLQVMEARKMVVRGTVRTHQAGPEAFSERSNSVSLMQLRNDLGQTFGTKKARKAIASLTENAISNKSALQTSPGGSQRSKLDSVATAMLESMAEATGGMATRDELAAAIDESKPRPKANLAAEYVKDVYTLESLMGQDIMKMIPVKEWQDAVKAKKEVITKSKYVAHRLQKVASDFQKLKALRYLLCLLEFFGSARPKGRGMRLLPYKDGLRAAISGVPEGLIEHIRRKFSVNGQILKFQTDLLITHACVLALIVDNYEVDMHDLREDLQLEVKEISQYFREIGAKVFAANEVERKKLSLDKAAAAQRKFARLRLPLEFPKLKFSRKK